jgi:hypothetical protein
MKSLRSRRSAFLPLLASLALVLAGAGAAEIAGHHGAAAPSAGTFTQLLGGHDEPDAPRHLDQVTGERTAFGPGCRLQDQLGGSHLPDLAGVTRPAGEDDQFGVTVAAAVARAALPRTSRGPPSSC